jgi:hypothetical protein
MLVVNTAPGTGLHLINTAAGIAGDQATGWRAEKSWLDYRQHKRFLLQSVQMCLEHTQPRIQGVNRAFPWILSDRVNHSCHLVPEHVFYMLLYEGKVCSRHEGTWREQTYSAIHSYQQHQMEVGCQLQAPTVLPPGKNPGNHKIRSWVRPGTV